MIHVNVREAGTRFSSLLTKVEEEQERIKICRNGKPIALLIPLGASSPPLKQHPKLMQVKIHEDPTAPLDEDEWPGELR